MSRIIDALNRHARDCPGQLAVRGSHVLLTWPQLADEVSTLADTFTGVRALGMLMANSPAWIVVDLAAIKASVLNVPLPPFFNDEQLQHALQDAGIDTVITDDPERIALLTGVIRTDQVSIAGKTCYRLQLRVPEVHPPDKGISKLTYTSGTTGSPRGVRLTLAVIETVAASLATAAAASDSDRAMVLLPLAILLENIGSVYVPILAGASMLVPDSTELGLYGSSRVDADKLAAILEQTRPTALIVPPALLKLLVALAGKGLLPDSLRFIATGSAPVGSHLLAAAQSLGLPVFQGYGLSEAGSVVSLNTFTDNRPGSTGKPLPHVQVHISETGEVMVQGNTFAGYLGGRERNTGELLATGDSGYLDDDGYLFITGRIGERIITPFGRNLSPEWIEAELESQPAISRAVILGNDLPYLVGILVPTKSATHAELDAAVKHVNTRLPDYACIGGWLPATSMFTVAGGELSAGGAPRRSVIEQNYSRQLDGYRQQAHENIL